jgi:hypothetical protein
MSCLYSSPKVTSVGFSSSLFALSDISRVKRAANHFACQTKHRCLAWVFKRNIRLSFALRSEAAQLSKAIALKWTCVLEPFTRGGLSL